MFCIVVFDQVRIDPSIKYVELICPIKRTEYINSIKCNDRTFRILRTFISLLDSATYGYYMHVDVYGAWRRGERLSV